MELSGQFFIPNVIKKKYKLHFLNQFAIFFWLSGSCGHNMVFEQSIIYLSFHMVWTPKVQVRIGHQRLLACRKMDLRMGENKRSEGIVD
jgi:hypothetical protein